ncbi:MAG TPA: AAC(3) family N-acetyltransferase [Thermoanaerobaculia bacterium]|jgi:aminoglycoside 3-N-acetyltransferase|nr:AAC(3) family N-acetyltransferase [Thermoanaerobaculia bacterium]
MQTHNLFKTSSGRWVTNVDFLKCLQAVKAPACDLLFVHSEMSFGVPSADLGRRGLLEVLIEALKATGVRTIAMPTFTFSFCNGVPYDRLKSRSQMGALNEFFRALPETERSQDPLMSVAVAGSETSIVRDLPHASLGRGSTFDRIHQLGDRVRFLFLGVSPAKCFTYTHYVEKCLEVPYRYDRQFTGMVIDGGLPREETWTLFVRYGGVVPTTSLKFVDAMRRERIMLETPYGDSVISSIGEPEGYSAVESRLLADIDYFLDTPYPRERSDKQFQAENMVAL